MHTWRARLDKWTLLVRQKEREREAPAVRAGIQCKEASRCALFYRRAYVLALSGDRQYNIRVSGCYLNLDEVFETVFVEAWIEKF